MALPTRKNRGVLIEDNTMPAPGVMSPPLPGQVKTPRLRSYGERVDPAGLHEEGDEFDDLFGDEPLHDVEDQWDMIDVIKNLTERAPQVEQQILKSGNPYWAYFYAWGVIDGRWSEIGLPEAESIIMKDPGWAHAYSRDVIKGRWPEAESSIMKDPERAKEYKMRFGISESEEFDDSIEESDISDFEVDQFIAESIVAGQSTDPDIDLILQNMFAEPDSNPVIDHIADSC